MRLVYGILSQTPEHIHKCKYMHEWYYSGHRLNVSASLVLHTSWRPSLVATLITTACAMKDCNIPWILRSHTHTHTRTGAHPNSLVDMGTLGLLLPPPLLLVVPSWESFRELAPAALLLESVEREDSSSLLSAIAMLTTLVILELSYNWNRIHPQIHPLTYTRPHACDGSWRWRRGVGKRKLSKLLRSYS